MSVVLVAFGRAFDEFNFLLELLLQLFVIVKVFFLDQHFFIITAVGGINIVAIARRLQKSATES